MLTDRIIRQVTKFVGDNPNTNFRISISIDGDEQLHDKIRGIKGSYSNAKNTMFGATSKDGIQLYDEEKESFVPYSCTGELPWLQQQKQCKKTLDDGKQDDKQTETAIGVIARATSLYYSKIIRGIIIPQLAHPIVKYLQSEECKTRIQAWRDADIDDDKKIAELILCSISTVLLRCTLTWVTHG